MFNNISGKIKMLAIFSCIFGIIASVIVGFSQIDHDGILILISGCLGSWIGAFFIYGFGELIEQATIAAENTTEIRNALAASKPAPVPSTAKSTIAQSYASEAKPISRAENSTHPAPVGTVTPIHDGTTDEIICPNCGTRQKENRRVCWSCGQEFTK